MKRRGHSLVEALAMITLIGVVMSLLAGGMHRMYAAHNRLQSELAVARALDRLADRLRSDAHLAEAVTPRSAGGSDVVSRIELADRAEGTRIVYHIVRGRVERIVKRKGKTTLRESFPLPTSARAEWVLDGQPARSLTLRWEPDTEPSHRAALATTGGRIRAAVGVLLAGRNPRAS